jgi:tetratricopeptide (TPR) repeat protein
VSATGRILLLLAAIPLCAACVSTAERVEGQVEAVSEEQSPDKLVARGRAFARVGDFTRAEQYFAAALDAGGNPDDVLPLLLKVCLAEQRYRSALAYAEPQLNKKPDDFRLRFVVGSLYAAIGEKDTAKKHLAKVAEEKPDYAEVHFAMGMLALDGDGDRVTADGYFREYLRLAPKGSHAEEARGYLLQTVP